MDRRVRAAFDWLFRDRATGRIVIAQWPNLSMGIVIVAAVVRRLFDPRGTAGTVLLVISTGAILWWAIDEVVRGVNPWRRLLGGVVAVATVVGLLVR